MLAIRVAHSRFVQKALAMGSDILPGESGCAARVTRCVRVVAAQR